MDITPLIPKGKHLINSYGDGGFTINDTRIDGSVLLFPEEVLPWPVTDQKDLSIEHFATVIERAKDIEVLLVGMGKGFGMLSPAMRNDLSRHAIAVETMDTGAACRTYNVLLSEERKVAAALIAV